MNFQRAKLIMTKWFSKYWTRAIIHLMIYLSIVRWVQIKLASFIYVALCLFRKLQSHKYQSFILLLVSCGPHVKSGCKLCKQQALWLLSSFVQLHLASFTLKLCLSRSSRHKFSVYSACLTAEMCHFFHCTRELQAKIERQMIADKLCQKRIYLLNWFF